MALPPPPPVYIPMDPRIRRRRIEVRRDAGRRRLRLLLAVAGVLAATLAGSLALRSPVLDVDRVRVDGAARTPAEAVLQAAGIHRGEAMVDVDLEGAERAVEALPWVALATARRGWPGTVFITVTERVAAAVTSTDADGWALLDASGRVLEIVAARPPDLLVLEGLGAVAPPGQVAAAAAGPLAVGAALSPALRARTAAVAVAEGGQVELKLNPRGTVRLGPPEGLPAKVRAIETVLASVDVRDLAALDVRLPSSPVLTRG